MVDYGDAPGSLPDASESELMMGMKMPPARAVVLGMAGARNASARHSNFRVCGNCRVLGLRVRSGVPAQALTAACSSRGGRVPRCGRGAAQGFRV